MYKKEFRDILFPTALRLSPQLVFPLVLLLNAMGLDIFKGHMEQIPDLACITLWVQVLWIAGNYGQDLFKYEYKDNAMEYLFGFPYTKSRIMLFKLSPRLLVLTGLITVYLGLFFYFSIKAGSLSNQNIIVSGIVIPLELVIVFLCAGVFTSFLEDKKNRLMLNFVLFISMLLCRAVAAGTMVVFPRWHILGICASLLVPVLLMAVAYFSVYRKWDPACLPSFGKKFSSRFLIMVGILDAVAVLVLMRNIIF